MRNIIKDKNDGISFWGAIGAIVWYDLILSTIIIGIVFAIIKDIAHVQPNTMTAAWVNKFRDVVGYIIAILLMLKYLKKKGLKGLSIKGNINVEWIIFILLFFTGYVLFSGNTIDLVTSQIPMPKSIEEAFEKISSNRYLMFFTMTVVAPIFEEIICRGIILELFLKRYKDLVALVFSALIFGSLHMNIPQFISAFIGGMMLGYVYLKTKSLIACILGHFCHNFIICVLTIIRPNSCEKFNLVELVIGIILMAISIWVVRKNVKETSINEVVIND